MNNLRTPTALNAKRHRAEMRFRWYGFMAIGISLSFLMLLLSSIVAKGYTAFTETQMALDITLPKDLAHADYDALTQTALKKQFPNVSGRRDVLKLYGLISSYAGIELKHYAETHSEQSGTLQKIWLTASSHVDMARKGKILKSTPEANRIITNAEFARIEQLQAEGRLRSHFNIPFFKFGDSREPEQAGFLGSIVGSLFIIITCLALAFPLGVMTAIYLEEFAPKNRLTDAIEVNINNLAAVPSIIFGLLGLALFLQWFGLPRSSSLVGGLTLALLVLPTLVITTRNSLKSIPPSIRQAALALGASPIQVVLHHTLPLSLPGIMTGMVLSIARAIGETAPLLMIGMVAFIADVPRTPLDPATAMPVQIYLWSSSPELGFAERTSAGIMVLIGFLIIANTLAALIRTKFERKW